MQKVVGHFTRNLNIRANRDFIKDLITKSHQRLGEVFKITQEHISVEEALRALYPHSNKKKGQGKN